MGRTKFKLPNIFRYLDYAVWLTDAFEALRAIDRSFTHRRFSEKCGYRSSGAISLIMSRKRGLSESGARKIAKALKLTAAERDHFVLMVTYEQSQSFDERQRLLRKMSAAKGFAERWENSLSAFEFYKHWYLPAVREIVSLDDFVEDPEWIARRLHGVLSSKQAQGAVNDLVRLGYLRRDSSGRLRPTQAIIATPSEVQSDVLKQHQREMMRLAAQALDSQDATIRDMRVATMAISRSQGERIKALLTQLQKEVLSIVEEDEPIEMVFQLNTQWFALTNPPKSKEENK